MSAERAPAPAERLALRPRIPLSFSGTVLCRAARTRAAESRAAVSRTAHSLASHPARIKVGAAAASVAAIAGVAAVAGAGASPPALASATGTGTHITHASASSLAASSASRLTPLVPASGTRASLATQHPAARTRTVQAPATKPLASNSPAPALTPAPAPRAAATHPAAAKTASPGSTSQQSGTRDKVAAVAKPSQSRAAAPRPARPQTFNFYDSVTPQEIPAGQRVATYATGGFAVPASHVAGRGPVLWIDTQGTDYNASVLDVEPGDATPSVAASWAWHKLHADSSSLACIYTMRSEWPAVRAAISRLPGSMRTQVRWWIADPTGYRHIVSGATATQWYWGQNYDISTANSRL